MSELPPLKVMVASTVHGFETELDQICATLSGYGYQVLSSHLGTVPVNPLHSNQENCLNAVRACDAFLGIIRPFYGTGITGDFSITHEEMKLAVSLGKLRWILVHEHVEFMRVILRTNSFATPFNETDVFDDLRVLAMYKEVREWDKSTAERKVHWSQPFRTLPQILRFIDTNFSNVDSIRQIIAQNAV